MARSETQRTDRRTCAPCGLRTVSEMWTRAQDRIDQRAGLVTKSLFRWVLDGTGVYERENPILPRRITKKRPPHCLSAGLDQKADQRLALLWRFSREASCGNTEQVGRVEHMATWVVAVTLALPRVYVLFSFLYGLAPHAKPESSSVGIGVSINAVIVMPYLAFRKRWIAGQIESGALEGDAAESITCAYMAGPVLVGLERALQLVVGRIHRRLDVLLLAGEGNMGSVRGSTRRERWVNNSLAGFGIGVVIRCQISELSEAPTHISVCKISHGPAAAK